MSLEARIASSQSPSSAIFHSLSRSVGHLVKRRDSFPTLRGRRYDCSGCLIDRFSRRSCLLFDVSMIPSRIPRYPPFNTLRNEALTQSEPIHPFLQPCEVKHDNADTLSRYHSGCKVRPEWQASTFPKHSENSPRKLRRLIQ
jgi:hypothetical protein